MSLFTKIRDAIEAPVKAVMKFDPLYQKLTTGHFTGGITGYNARWRAAIHEVYKVDPISSKIGIKESTIFNVGRVVGVVVATYFTAGLAAKVFAGMSVAEGVGTALKVGMAAKAISDQQKAKDEASKQQAVAAAQAAEAEKQATIAAQLNAKPSTPVSTGAILSIIAIAASLLS